ncbi:hypothetical protein GPALN_006686 [Globodera pallida]|nr:hypothetical protein GPALN_006686 [Globodera pallida]
MTNSFFVILPSNTPGFVGNKTNKFKVHLPKKLVFEGPGWMVGMSGIIYPNSWATVGTLEKQYVIVHLRDGRKYRFRVPSGSFLSPQQLERGIHHGMIAEMERLMTRKRAALEEEEGELIDLQVVEEEQGVEAPLLPMRNETAAQERERAQKEEKEKLAYEKENDRLRRLEEDRKEKERLRRLEEERKEKERLRLLEEERKERERLQLENERKVKRQKWIADGRKETERLRLETERKETERLQRIENERNESERVGKEKQEAENERLEKQKKEEKVVTQKKEEETPAKQPEAVDNGKNKALERLARPTEEEERMRRDQERKFRLRELELLKGLKPYRGGWMRLVQGKDPTPDVHYLHEKDEYHFANAADKYRLHHPELAWDLPEFNPSAHIQRNIAEFKGLFEREVYDENYGSKTREEKQELIALVKGFRFYYMEDIGRFMLKIFDNKISHITLTDQLAYVLGYEQEQQILNDDLAKYSVDLGGGVSHLCIYLNSGSLKV